MSDFLGSIIVLSLAIFFAYLSIEFKRRFNYEHEKFNNTMKSYSVLQKLYEQLKHELSDTKNSYSQLLSKYNYMFDKYSPIFDAQAEARRILDDAHSKESEVVKKLQTADAESQKIIIEAQQKAQEIAGEAIEARDNAKLYETAVKSLKNIILGYGNDYLIPSQSLLDDLADSYGFSQASKEYKIVREKVRNIIKLNQAASCDYSEPSRRQTAINFISDAFNGKAENILAHAKSDNFGTLRQKLTDAFTLVNLNGKAFRNARINQEFFMLRLEELKLACTLQEIHKRDIEEQRRIKEQMREEEKARRDFEKAMRDAAHEEELLQKAMAKAQAMLEKANAEQKAQYEAQIKDLQLKYLEAEERNKRALSMAQQTKSGYVYIISNEGSFGDNVFKIGMTRRLEPLDRIKELSSASVPFAFDVHAFIWSEDAPALENLLHKKFALFQVNKVNFRKEFFRIPLADIKAELDALNLNVNWTIAAEAAEFKESIAIEKLIRDNPQAREEWLNHQLQLETNNVEDFDDSESEPSQKARKEN